MGRDRPGSCGIGDGDGDGFHRAQRTTRESMRLFGGITDDHAQSPSPSARTPSRVHSMSAKGVFSFLRCATTAWPAVQNQIRTTCPSDAD